MTENDNHCLLTSKHININNKLLMYKLLKPTWTYAIRVWDSAKQSKINKIQKFQLKTIT